MYGSAFCRVYNEFGWNVYPEVFGSQLLEWLRGREKTVNTALDLGCGTGVLCRVLADVGIATRGTDLSEGMIERARENFPGLDFAVADMVTDRPAKTYDLVTCTGDALNHIFELSDVRKIFDNVRACLAPGGLFVFDLLSENEVPDGEPFELDYSESVKAVFSAVREDANTVHLRIEVFENGIGSVTEDIFEKIHDVDAVCALLRESGLRVLQRGHRLLPDDGPPTATWFIIAENTAE